MVDTLNDAAKEIEEQVTTLGLMPFHCENLEDLWADSGVDTPDRNLMVSVPQLVLEWDRNQGGYMQFLQAAKAMKTPVIYMKAKRFSWQKDLYSCIETDTSQYDCDYEDVKRQTQLFRKYDGFVEYILLAFRQGDIWHAYQEATPWHKAAMDLLDERQA